MEYDEEKVKEYVRTRADHAAEEAFRLGVEKEKAQIIGDVAHKMANLFEKNELQLFVIIFNDLIDCYDYVGIK